MEIEIKILSPENLEEFNQLLTIFDLVFEYEPYTRPEVMHLEKLLKSKSFYAIVALLNDKMIAGLTAYNLEQYHSTKPILYLQDLAVLNEYQRKGVGRKLIDFTKAFCAENGFQQMFIQAEKVDDYAVDFYRSTKPTGEMEVMYFYYENA